MKIGNNPDKTPKVTGTHQPATGEAAKAGVASVAQDESAKVALSSTAATLLSGSSTPEFDAAKVDRVSKAIADGTYKVNPEVVADKLIANAQELLGKAQR